MSHPKEVSHQLIIGGGGQQVTGSFYAIERTEERKGKKVRDVLVMDCGLFQEKGSEIENADEKGNIEKLADANLESKTKESSKDWIFRKNFLEIPIDTDAEKGPIRQMDIVITHAHFDHCARLLILIKVLHVLYPGIQIRIICTEETRALLPIALRDSCGIQEKVIRSYEGKMKDKEESLSPRHEERRGRRDKPWKEWKGERRKDKGHQNNGEIKQPPLKGPYFYSQEDIDMMFSHKQHGEKMPYHPLLDIQTNIQTLFNMEYDLHAYIAVLKNLRRSIEYFMGVQADNNYSILSPKLLQDVEEKLGACIAILDQEKFSEIPDKEILEMKSQIDHILESRNQQNAGPFFVHIETPAYHDVVPALHNMRLRFLNAGHILGSASILVELPTKYGNRTILYTGDLGSKKSETRIDLVGEPESIQVLRKKAGDFSDASGVPHVDLLISESTYGGRKRERQTEEITEMVEAIQSTIQRDGNVIVPSFALERSQDFLFKIYDMVVRMNHERELFRDYLTQMMESLAELGEKQSPVVDDVKNSIRQIQEKKDTFPQWKEELNLLESSLEDFCPSFKGPFPLDVSSMMKLFQHVQNKTTPVKVYMDSHLGIAFTKVFRDSKLKRYEELVQAGGQIGRDKVNEHIERFNKVFVWHDLVEKPVPSMRDLKGKKNKQDIRQEHFVQIHDDRPCIIVTSSGMGDHGPSRTHIEMGLQDKRNLLLLIGYMAKGTLGRTLLESRGKPDVMIAGQRCPLKATIHHLEAFSSHADQEDLLKYFHETLRWSKGKRKIILVHGEPEQMVALAGKITEGKSKITGISPADIQCPKTGEKINLDKLLE